MLFFAFLSAVGCMEEPQLLFNEDDNALKDGYLTIEFAQKSFEEVSVTTRSTVPTAAEDAVVNMYVLMFNNEGNRIYGHHFTVGNRQTTKESLELMAEDGWWVDNQDSGDGGLTVGRIRMKAPENITDGRLYLFANIDPVILNLSVERLNLIRTEKELQKMSLNFNQETTSRTGNLLMIGSARIDVGAGSNTISYTPDVYYNPSGTGGTSKICLERIDSKIEVNVAVVPGAVTEKKDKDGNVVSTQEIESFTPTSWKVVNLPRDTWFLARESLDASLRESLDATKEGGFFTSSDHLFETKVQQLTTDPDYRSEQADEKPRTVHGFSFYMLESYPKMSDTEDKESGETLEPVTSFNQRDLRFKNGTTGEYAEKADGNIWAYAPKNAAYLVVKGEVKMKVNEVAAAAGTSQTLNAMVVYYIHLGHFVSSKAGGSTTEALNNFDIVCNTHYKYNINIKGVDAIEVEVTRDNAEAWAPDHEKQSGATGEVFIAQETIYTFDSHYGQRVFRFNFDAILTTLGVKVENGNVSKEDAVEDIADDLTWYISSSFGREGTPDKTSGNTEIPNGLDYKWVYFLRNDKYQDPEQDDKMIYSHDNQWYPGDQYRGRLINDDVPNNPTARGKSLMDVSQLCVYLREQIVKRVFNEDNDFDADNNIYFTAFVDEYYYDADPLSQEPRDNLWREFVNKPMRMMHILCSAMVSKDGESSATGSVVTIRQRSIQTVYNTSVAEDAWGGETVDEVRGKDGGRASVGFFSEKDAGLVGDMDPVGNTSKNNGMYNTVRLWKFVDDKGTDDSADDTFKDDVQWNTYLNYNRRNDYDGTEDNKGDVIINFMNEGYRTLRYSCLMRNRDNNGNGLIDESEIKWYLASTEQLVTLFIGDLGLEGASKLYNIENPTSSNYTSHVISSTAHSGTSCETQRIWAEEGCSISKYYTGWPGTTTTDNISIRCVRNLKARPDGESAALDEQSYPRPPIEVRRLTRGTGEDTEVYYRFDMRKLNDASKRIKVSDELVPLDENSEMSRLYDGFETGIETAEKIGNGGTFNTTINDFLMKGYTYCPDGYRMPNIREAAVMQNYVDKDVNDDGIEDGTDAEMVAFWGNPLANSSANDKLYAVASYYSFGPKGENWDSNGQFTWTYGQRFMSLTNGENRYVRCVRDVDP